MNAELLIKKIDELITAKAYDQIKELILKYKHISEKNNDIATLFYLLPIFEKEKAAGQKTIFDKVENTEQLLDRYTRLKFYLRRMDFDVIGNGMQDFLQFWLDEEVSAYELKIVMDQCVVHKEKVWSLIKGEG